jgi:NADPH:quinone reductase-like Zn-dependent oxidoreductase
MSAGGTIRTWQLPAGCTSSEQLEMLKVSMPIAGAGEVVIRVRANSLNYRDQLIPKGLYFGGPLRVPCTPLSDGAGVIESIGSGVTEFAVGDRVAGTFFQSWLDGPPTPAFGPALGAPPARGMLADFVVLPQTSVVKLADQLSFEEAATLPCAGVTAWNALMTGIRKVARDRTVLLIGTGGVSLLALKIAKAAGARVIATSSSDEKLARIRALGADATVNIKKEPQWGAKAAEISGGGVDQVVEVGGPGTLSQSMQAVGFGGEIALIGVLSREGDTNPMPLMVKGASVRGIFVGSREMARRLNEFVDEHRVKPVIDRVFDFADAKQAYAYQASSTLFGKVVISNSS